MVYNPSVCGGMTMWKKKKKKTDPNIKVHQLEIEKLKLKAQVKEQKNFGIAFACFFLLSLLVLLLWVI